jgi:hypothetical protein
MLSSMQRRSGGHLENPRRLGLDLFTNQRMEPFARGEVHLDAEAFFQQPFGCHQIEGAEAAARVVVYEKVESLLA